MNFVKDEQGFGNIIYMVIGLVVFIIMVASVALPVINGANTTYACQGAVTGVYNATCNWPAATLAMWAILPIVVIASLILYVIGKK